MVSACRTLDCPSIFANDVAQAWQVAQVMADFDALDSACVAVQALPVLRRARRVAVPQHCEFFGDAQAAAAFDKALKSLESLTLIHK